MPISKSQIILYGRTWNTAKKTLVSRGYDKEEIETERQDLLKLAGSNVEVSGRRSVKTLTNSQFSTFLDLIETTISGEQNQKRRSASLIWKIEKIGLPDSYLDKIARDQYRVDSWRSLPLNRLLNLLYTANNRARAAQ
tara:strand:+ start:110 stop:523 length:414 start_codon:yes stop_codon:yes gene_type:complete